MRALILALSLTVTWAAQAEVYKCTDNNGRKHYQDLPCAGDQRSSAFDPEAGNVTTIDSETSRREAQGALLTRQESRERRVEVTTPASGEPRVSISSPGYDTEPYDDRMQDYPVYHDGDRRSRRRDRDADLDGDLDGDRGRRQRPDETPMQDTAR